MNISTLRSRRLKVVLKSKYFCVLKIQRFEIYEASLHITIINKIIYVKFLHMNKSDLLLIIMFVFLPRKSDNVIG